MLKLSRTQASKDIPMDMARAKAHQAAVNMTSKVRAHYLTPIVGQEMTYAEKEKQAIAFLASEVKPDKMGSDYTFIFGEVGITGDNTTEVAERIIAVAGMFRTQVGPEIERLRLLAKKNINEATTEEDLDVIVAALIEDMENLI